MLRELLLSVPGTTAHVADAALAWLADNDVSVSMLAFFSPAAL